MFRIIARLLSPYALLFVLSTGLLAGTAHAQVPTPSKTFCVGELPLNLTTPPTCSALSTAAFVPVFYEVTLAPIAAGSYTLLETLPLGFTFVGAKCLVSGTSGFTPLIPTPPVNPTKLGPIALPAGQTTCFIQGYFTVPGDTPTNSVTVGNEPGNSAVSSPTALTISVDPILSIPTDLSVTKTVTYAGSPAPLDVSFGPQTVSYTIVWKNNGPQPVMIGQIGELLDKVSSLSGGVPMQAQLVPNSIQVTSNSFPSCAPLPTSPASPPATACLQPVPVVVMPPGWQTVTASPLDVAKWRFPSTSQHSNGYLPFGGTITVKYDMQIRRHPDLLCALGGEKLRNEAFFTLTAINGATITEIDNTNNTAHADVLVHTGQPNDPDCALSTQGPIQITKTQINPLPFAVVPWTTPVHYRITITNSAPTPITIHLRDKVMEMMGTPWFDAQVQSWTCTVSDGSQCIAPPNQTGPVVSLMSYFSPTPTVWNKPTITVPSKVGSVFGTVTVDIVLKYWFKSCDSFTSVDNRIRNYGRIDYTYNATTYMTEAYFETKMGPVPPCKLEVKKQVLDTDKVEFGVVPTLQYTVSYHNADSFPVTVGTLFDAMRIAQPNYATQLPYTNLSYTCTPTGSVSNIPPNASGLNGMIVYTTNPSQGTRIFQGGPVTFAAGATLACTVKITINRPPSNDQYCMSSGDPRLENLALMDVSDFYNTNLQWPPSGTYNASIPAATSQPSPLTNWSAVSVKLPKCYKVFVNKSVTLGFTWTPGGPALTYNVSVTNAGGTLTPGFLDGFGWKGLVFNDTFTSGFPSLPTPSPIPGFDVTSNCPSSLASWYPPTLFFGTTGVNIVNFGAGCTITQTFTLPGPFNAGNPPPQICNRANVQMLPSALAGAADTADWYSNIITTAPTPDPRIKELCVPVLGTSTLNVRKVVNNIAGAQLPSSAEYSMSVTCTTPNPAGGAPITSINIAHMPLTPDISVPNVPVGSTCVVAENVSQLPAITGTGSCKRPAVPTWLAPVYSPVPMVIAAGTENILTATNTLDCVEPIDLAITKTGPVLVGGLNNFTLTVTSPGSPFSIPPGGLTVTDIFTSAGIGTIASMTATPPGNWSCSTPPTCTYIGPGPTTAGQVLGTVTVSFALPLDAAGKPVPYKNCATVALAATSGLLETNLSNNTSCVAGGGVFPKVDLQINKTGPTAVHGSPGLAAFTLTVTNNGPSFFLTPNSITVTDTVTGTFGNFAGISATPAGWACSVSGHTATCTYAGSGTIPGYGAPLGTITLTYHPSVQDNFTNCASVGLTVNAPLQELTPLNNTSCVTVSNIKRDTDKPRSRPEEPPPPAPPPEPPAPPPSPATTFDVSLKKTSPGEWFSGSAGVFNLFVTNNGAALDSTTKIVVVDNLPADMKLVAAAGSGWRCGPSAPVTCTYNGAVSSGQRLPPVVITAIAGKPGTIENCAKVSLQGATDSVPANDSNCVTVTIGKARAEGGSPVTQTNAPSAGGVDIAVVKPTNVPNAANVDVGIVNTITSGRWIQGGTGIFTLAVTNYGAPLGNGVSIVVQDTLPAGLVLQSAVPGTSAWQCQTNGNDLRCSLTGMVRTGVQPVINVTARATRSGTFNNCATVVLSGASDTRPGNNTSCATLLVELDARKDPAVTPTPVVPRSPQEPDKKPAAPGASGTGPTSPLRP